ncbi:hypothetical protein [Arthrobacter sp. TMS2-4]
MAGLRALQPLLDDPTIEEVWINAPIDIYVAADGECELTTLSLIEEQVRDLVERMLKSSPQAGPVLAAYRKAHPRAPEALCFTTARWLPNGPSYLRYEEPPEVAATGS